MTGKHPGHAWVRDNGEVEPEGQHPIPDAETTIAEVLKKQGYATGAFGKWGIGFPGSDGDPLRQGFDRFFGYNCQRHAHSYYPAYLWSNDKRIPLSNSPSIVGHERFPKHSDPRDPASYSRFKGTDYAPDRIIEQSLGFIRHHQEKPFFLYYATPLPHVALHIPDEDLKPYLALGWKETPLTNGPYTPHLTPRAAYAAMITRMDRNVGRILKLLDELNLSKNTIVIFSSDNGTSALTKEVDTAFFKSVGELRGLKGSLYEGGVRVPTIVRWPSRVAAGSWTKRIIGFEDFLPTIAEIANGKLHSRIDGISFVPTVLGQDQAPRPFLYREFAGTANQQSIYFDNWKAIRPNMNKGGKLNFDIELYDLSADPGETNNLAAKHPSVVAKAAELFIREHTPSERYPIRALDSPGRLPRRLGN